MLFFKAFNEYLYMLYALNTNFYLRGKGIVMKIINEVLNVLNDSTKSYEDIISDLKEICAHRRGINRITVRIVINILEEWCLPINGEILDEEKYLFCNADYKVYENIKSIASKSKMTLFNASCNEFLFNRYHQSEMAECAIISYFSELIMPTNKKAFSFIKHALGLCRLFAKIGVKYVDGNKFLALCSEYIDSEKDNGYVSLFLLLGLKSIKDFSEFVGGKFIEMIKHYDENNVYYKSIRYREEVIKANTKDKTLVTNTKKEIVKLLEKQSNSLDWDDSANAFNIIDLIQRAMSILNQINDTEAKRERKRLAKLIEPVKKLSLKEMKIFSTESIDISSTIKKFESDINQSNFEEVVYKLAFCVRPLGLNKCKKMVNDSSVISKVFSNKLLDSQGRVVGVIPSLLEANEEEKMHYYEREAVNYNRILAHDIIYNFLRVINDKYDIKNDMIRFILEDNLFIPQNRLESFLSGIVAGFNYDFITALHILMPQVENAVRIFAEELGAVVYKTADNGTEECLSFESILNLPEITESLEEDFIFNLKVHYTSKYGFGMRNNIAHGLKNDEELNSIDGLAVWWYTFRLCCTYSNKLIKKIKTIEQES